MPPLWTQSPSPMPLNLHKSPCSQLLRVGLAHWGQALGSLSWHLPGTGSGGEWQLHAGLWACWSTSHQWGLRVGREHL